MALGYFRQVGATCNEFRADSSNYRATSPALVGLLTDVWIVRGNKVWGRDVFVQLGVLYYVIFGVEKIPIGFVSPPIVQYQKNTLLKGVVSRASGLCHSISLRALPSQAAISLIIREVFMMDSNVYFHFSIFMKFSAITYKSVTVVFEQRVATRWMILYHVLFSQVFI